MSGMNCLHDLEIGKGRQPSQSGILEEQEKERYGFETFHNDALGHPYPGLSPPGRGVWPDGDPRRFSCETMYSGHVYL